MIIHLLGNAVFTLLDTLLFFELPSLGDSVINIVNTAIGYMGDGLDVLHCFIGNTAMGVLGYCFGLVITANLVWFTISVVFFVLKKLPFLGIKE